MKLHLTVSSTESKNKNRGEIFDKKVTLRICIEENELLSRKA